MATTIGSCQSWANLMLVPTSETIQCLRDQWPDRVGDHSYIDPFKQGLQLLVPLGGIEIGGHTPLTEVANPPPLAEVENQLPQGVLLNCPPGQREVVMADHGTKGQSRNPERIPVNTGARHTQLSHHQPGWTQLARFMDMWPAKTRLWQCRLRGYLSLLPQS